MEHINRQFDKDIKKIMSRLNKMGKLVRTQIGLLLEFIEKPEEQFITDIDKIECETDTLEMDTYAKCVNIIAMRQPIASDLRLVLAINRGLSDLERMGDQVLNIAINLQKVQADNPQLFVEITPNLLKLIQFNFQALGKAIKLYGDFNSKSALKLATMDSKKVKKFQKTADQFQQQIVTTIQQHPQQTECGIMLHKALLGIERLSAHISNVAEQVIYAEHGIDARHGNLTELV